MVRLLMNVEQSVECELMEKVEILGENPLHCHLKGYPFAYLMKHYAMKAPGGVDA
jgi:hypothetical protein